MRLTKAGAIVGHKAFIIHSYTEVARVCIGDHFPSVARCRENLPNKFVLSDRSGPATSTIPFTG